MVPVLDDRSRVACHCQWYLIEDAENVAYGLSQSFQKRVLPRSGLNDNGGASSPPLVAAIEGQMLRDAREPTR